MNAASCGLPGLDRRLEQAGTALFAQPVAVAANGDDVAVVQQTIENGGRHHRIAEHGAPLANRAVAGEQQTAALVAARDELEEEMCGVGLKGR